jgi:hypothetical protein
MPTTFPGADDVYQVPALPVTTPLNHSGLDNRTHTNLHADHGDALVAMQAEATFLIHDHSGGFRQGSKLLQANTHESPDTDSATSSIHHTIDVTQTSATKYAAGTHTHPVVPSYPVGGFFFSVNSATPESLGITGTWASVGQRFLVAQGGSMGLVAGVNGGSNTHIHTVPTSGSSNPHSHTNSSLGATGSHAHGGGTTSSNGVSHTHGSTQVGQSSGTSGPETNVSGTHTHTTGSASASHSHSVPSTSSDGSHAHTVADTGTEPAHTHTVSNLASASNLVPYLVVYMWKRTA